MRAAKRFGAAAALIAIAAIAVACGAGEAEEEGSGGSLTVNMAVAPGTIDPAIGCGLNDLALIGNLYTQLTQYGTQEGPDGTERIDPNNIEPYAAESWEVSDDGTTYTFTLHPDMTFPSGEPVDSEAVKYSVERTITMNGCGFSFLYDLFLDPPLIEEIRTPDPLTVVFELIHPDPNFPQALAQPAGGIVDKTVVDQHGGVEKDTPNRWMQSHAAGAGPFLLEQYEPNTRAVLTANPDFVGPPPASEEIAINYINSDPTLLLQARSGEADVTLGLSKQSLNDLEGDDNVRLIANETSLAVLVGLPNTKPPFDNPTFREGLSHAIPSEQIVEEAAFGFGEAFFGPIIPSMDGVDEELSQPRPYDPERARELIEESGVETPVEVEMVVQDGNTADEQVATIAQAEWADLGVNVNIRKLAAAEYIEGLQAHRYQSFIRLDGPGVIDAGYFLSYDMRCEVVFNLTEACIPKADRLLDQARAEQDPEERQRLYGEITRLWNAETPKIPVYMDQDVAALANDVEGYLWSHETDFRTWSK